MSRTVDLVIVGMRDAACAAANEAARDGRRVLVVDLTTSADCRRQFRRAIERDVRHRVSVMTGVEVVCVDGVKTIEVVLLRHISTRRLIGINARAVLWSDGRSCVIG